MAEQIGLQIYFEKTDYIGIQTKQKIQDTKYVNIERVDELRYLGEIVTPTELEGKAQQNRLKLVEEDVWTDILHIQ